MSSPSRAPQVAYSYWMQVNMAAIKRRLAESPYPSAEALLRAGGISRSAWTALMHPRSEVNLRVLGTILALLDLRPDEVFEVVAVEVEAEPPKGPTRLHSVPEQPLYIAPEQ